MTLLKQSLVYLVGFVVSSLILLLAFKFATLAGPLLVLSQFRWLLLVFSVSAVILGDILRTRSLLHSKPLIVRHNFLK